MLRYIECNPVRAHMVARAEDWRWSRARVWKDSIREPSIEEGPVARPHPWLGWVNEPMEEPAVHRIRQSVNRGTPFGSESWMIATAARLGLDASLRPLGRPQKVEMV